MINRKLVCLLAMVLLMQANIMVGTANGQNSIPVGSITDDATTALEGPQSIVIVGNLAYVTGQSDHGVEILDISDPTNPTHVGAIFDDATTASVGTTTPPWRNFGHW